MSASPPPIGVSVIVPTFNRRDRLELVLRSLAAQDIAEPFEVVVVSDGSTDGTDEYLHGDALPLPIVPLSQANQGPAGARNLGVAHSRGDVVVFIDDDVVADQSLLRAHLAAHRRLGNRAVVIGPMLSPPDHEMSPWIAWEQQMLAKQYLAMEARRFSPTSRQFYTGNASMRVEQFRAAGGFNASFRRAEDVELAFRLDDLGAQFHFERAAVGMHYAERSYDAWRQTAYAYGRNDVVFARDLGRTNLFEFIKDAFQHQHPLIQGLVKRSIHSESWRARSTYVFERIIRGDSASATEVGRRMDRYALSGIYAIEYHRGVADELGTTEAFDHLIRYGEHIALQQRRHGPDRSAGARSATKRGSP